MSAVTCPYCQSLITPENVIASNAYCSCGWYGPVNHEQVKRKRAIKKWIGRAALTASLVFCGYLVMEYRAWGKFMGNAVVLQAKAALGLASKVDWLELGYICNTLKRPACSEEAFTNILNADPMNKLARSNLAMAQTDLGKFQQALANFEIIFADGDGSLDATAYYAMALEGMGRDREAETWYLRTLSMTPRLADITNRVLNLMVKRDAYFEAMSLIGSVTSMVPEAATYFRPRLLAISDLASKEKISGKRKQLRLATVRDHHQLPIKFGEMNRPGFFMVDTGATMLVLSREFVAENKVWKYKFVREAEMKTADGRNVSADVVVFPEVQVGPWMLQDVQAVICEGCALLAGKSILRNFNMISENRAGVEYLTLRR